MRIQEGTAIILRTRFAPILVVAALSAALAALVAPPAKSDTGCAGYADPLNRAEAFWTRARAEQVRACVVQLGAGPGSDRRRLTPLHLAALFSADPAALAPLLKAGADPNAKATNGFTPLHLAAQKNSNPAVAAALLKAGADPNARTRKGATPLHLAAQKNSNPAVAAALLKAGADPNAKGDNGATPLHLAALKNSNPAVVAALLKAGADPTAVAQGKTAFDLARNNKKLAGSVAYRQLREAHDAQRALDTLDLTMDDYRVIQRMLNEKEFRAGAVDGRWGPKSRSALRDFQALAGLGRTGVPDKATLKALGFRKTAKSGTRRIPGAPELGWVEVERRHSAGGLGWQCDTPGHLGRISEVRRGTFSDTEPIDARVWNRTLRVYVLKRLTEYYPERGKPGLQSRDRSFSWRDWLRGTLERINMAADEAGMPQKKKETALLAWVMCHVSLTEAARIRGRILASEEEGK